MRRSARRVAAVLAVPAVTLTALAGTSAQASAAVDPGPAASAAAWLKGQLTDGVIHNTEFDFDDIGLTIDTALALDAVGDDSARQAIADAVAPYVADDETGYAEVDEYDFSQTPPVLVQRGHYAGATAKALWLAKISGKDVHTYGGVDLQQSLEDLVATDAPIAGRIVDDSSFGDFANTVGQIFAAESLTSLSSDRASSVRSFLLEQQCDGGYLRLNFTEDKAAADQSCDGGSGAASAPDTDVTALFLIAMRPFTADPAVAAAVEKATTWLTDQQRANGSFGGGPSTEAPNANSTGVAGWALGDAGNIAAAEDAAAWVRAHQATNVANCVYYDPADPGAIAYDNTALGALQGAPIDSTTQDQFRRAASQALPVLQWAPAGAGDPQVLFAAEYVKAGGKKPVGVVQATPGEALCAMLGEQSVLGYADADGQADLRVLIPGRTKTSKVKVANAAGAVGTARINALGAKKLPFTLKDRVAPGRKQTIKVRGLAPGETASVSISWPRSKGQGSGSGTGGQANAKGVFTASIKVPHRPGKATVKVKGQFGNRKAGKTFTVTR